MGDELRAESLSLTSLIFYCRPKGDNRNPFKNPLSQCKSAFYYFHNNQTYNNQTYINSNL